ncbi:MAG: glutathione S-transferase family protein [Paucibacter sp.]|nr:glutathione S-transferase family protein [Roseateles sp.]
MAKLYIGNKNYSSWSMRPWVLARALGIPFEEVMVRFDFAEADSQFHKKLQHVTPAGRVPVWVENDGFAVWDTLAIIEHLAERHGDAGVWPQALNDRSRARSLCAEMHAGFSALRNACPMNIEAYFFDQGKTLWVENPGLRKDVARIDELWSEALAASGGPWLFGKFSAADAFYAPVAVRLSRFALPVSAAAGAYVERVLAHGAVQEWTQAALAEQQYVPEDEPYRKAR